MRGLCLLLLLLGACAPPPQVGTPLTRVFSCEGDYRFTLRSQAGEALLFMPAQEHRLTAIPVQAGEGYADQRIELRIKGETARLTDLESKLRRSCRNDRRAALWEDARFRGIDFRAIGSEAGWFLELDPGQVLYAGDYGRQLISFAYAPPQVSDARAQTIYSGLSASGQQLELKLEAGLCVDRVNRDRYDTRVTLRIDDQTRYGCGRYLVKRGKDVNK